MMEGNGIGAALEGLPPTTADLAAWVKDASPAAVEAQASWWLRELGGLQAELGALSERRDAELSLVTQHYARQAAPLEARATALTLTLEALALSMPTPKGRKSVELAYGTIGRRTQPARVAVVDKDAALQWARRVGAVRVTEAVDAKAAQGTILALVAESGETPDGWEYIAECETAVVRPNTRAAVEVGG